MLKSFAPEINKNTRIMVIGTMPGKESLRQQQYYAYERNAFWKIISKLFNNGEAFSDYKQKINCLLDNGIGLWDSLQYCERETSLDSDIKNEQPNDFETLLKENPQVVFLAFNGQKAFKFFKQYHAKLLKNIQYEILPSTSPANASIPFQTKLEKWKSVLLSKR